VGPRAATVVRLERALALAHGCFLPVRGARMPTAGNDPAPGTQECPPVAGDDQSLGGQHRCRQNSRVASLSGRHAVTSVVLAYTGLLWQHSRLVSLRCLAMGGGPRASWHVGDPGSAANTVIHSCGQLCGRMTLLASTTGRRGSQRGVRAADRSRPGVE
jgi:hypothetical protein